ncbi:MAG: hypothetical protein EBR24_08395, partial [Flavobacteriia bacterium]|nr:hypothetical protein [Flavobacteriia bacterium]
MINLLKHSEALQLHFLPNHLQFLGIKSLLSKLLESRDFYLITRKLIVSFNFCASNGRLAKLAVQCSLDTFVVIHSWFFESTLILLFPIFAKFRTVNIDMTFCTNCG